MDIIPVLARPRMGRLAVVPFSYTPLTLPTIPLVSISVLPATSKQN